MNSSTSFLDVLSNAFAAVFILLMAVAVKMGSGKQAETTSPSLSASSTGDVPVTSLDLFPVPKKDFPDSLRISITIEALGANAAQAKFRVQENGPEMTIETRQGTGDLKNRWRFFQDGPMDGQWQIESFGVPRPDSVYINVFQGIRYACMKRVAIKNSIEPFVIVTVSEAKSVNNSPNILINHEACY